ncbi:MAG: T9SS type A sorting domain-containing protein [Candidatus Cloacimonetes bacterium]|nr:T9SS type A sorting domain-containing protein [Candidatus Cloacimonadota bacterium]MCF7812893.1 T9SS type A sorting domain-containing protein [Candidatus Cloacimonadota bacterium]MCF7867105.1 T9SS type A sorting domain-containing protein [Candidatus Cloacimonadota bacterium]MCF7882575.1 T9SS type A sorting domain-containing protein [Candidatus Cloacimonadota bacterium]
MDIIPDPSGILEVSLSWTCPENTFYGTPLTELLGMRVYRDDVLIYTDEDPVIGGPGSYLDNTVPDNGMYEYRIVGYNSYGEGIPYVESVWVGEDVPAAVENLLCEQTAPGILSATLTWDNPTTGLHGGAFNMSILGYHIVRYPDNCVFELAGIATEFIDDTIPAAGIYYYSVQPYNAIGDGGIAESNIPWWPPLYLILEDFTTWLPDGWTTESTSGQVNWVHGMGNNAGGNAPEAQFSWSPSTTATQRLISPILNTEDCSALMLEFWHSVNDYDGDPYTLRVQTTSDGTNWNTVWEIEPIANIDPQIISLNFISPDVGSETFQIAWVFEGNSFDINYWYVDDVMLNPGYAGTIEGMVTLDGGNGNVEDVEVIAGDQTVHPDANGDYSITIEPGTYDVMATLINYETDIIEDVIVIPGQVTDNIDLTLEWFGGNYEPPGNVQIDENTGILSWLAPPLNTLSGFNVYLDSTFVDFTEETEWQFENLVNGQTYLAGVSAVYDDGGESVIINIGFIYEGTGVLQELDLMTGITTIYPNPFNPATTISFNVPQTSSFAAIEIYNLKGQKVKTFAFPNGSFGTSVGSVVWNGNDDKNKSVASGIYFCKFKSGKVLQTRKMLLLK